MAAQQTLQRELCAVAGAVALDGFHRVIRAGGIKAAGSAEKGTEDELIGTNQEKQEARAQACAFEEGGFATSAAASSASSSRSMAVKGAVATELRG